jgi:hypothetical protein
MLRRAAPAILLTIGLPLAACSDDTTVGSGGSGGASSSAGGATSVSGPSAGSTSSSGAASTSSGGQGGSAGEGGGASSAGGGGEGPAGPTPWTAPIERCGMEGDEDQDGRVDEDCPPSLFTGVYAPAGTGLTDPSILDAIEGDTGVTLPVIQTYRSTSVTGAANARLDLAAIWARGSTPHLNVEPLGYTPTQFADAGDDPDLAADVGAIATAVAESLAEHPGKNVLLTFSAEMNGEWTDWGCLAPATYIDFYRWAHGVFVEALADQDPPVDTRRLRWVFGPNNVSSDGCASAADYYPGHAHSDFLGMSSYRSGTQSIASAVVEPAHDLLDAVMPEAWQADRFVVLQTGTRDEQGDDRDAWIRDLHTILADDEVFRGVIYFDAADWSVIDAGDGGVIEKPGYEGLVDAFAAAPLADARLEGTFDPFFWDVPFAHPSYAEIQSLRAAEISSGCGIAPPRFCPDLELTRGDASVMVARAFGVQPDPPGDEPTFDDVPLDHPAYGFIEATTALGALVPCDDGLFCPSEAITRGALVRALVRLGQVEGAPDGAAPFADLETTGEDATIQLLAEVGHVDGCASDLFCPQDPALRDAAARWVVRVAAVTPATAP